MGPTLSGAPHPLLGGECPLANSGDTFVSTPDPPVHVEPVDFSLQFRYTSNPSGNQRRVWNVIRVPLTRRRPVLLGFGTVHNDEPSGGSLGIERVEPLRQEATMTTTHDAGNQSPLPDPDSPTAWMGQGLCRMYAPSVFFPSDGVGVEKARKICAGCPVKTECLEHALEHRIEHGVWGGASERERRRILKRMRDVSATR
jgi:WhiB family redox-sensing transcriptional regulator